MSTDAEEIERAELSRKDCFLCHPQSRFLTVAAQSSYALAGLGPIVPGYTIVATKRHVELEHLPADELLSYAQHVESVQRHLIRIFGGCLITEHGNLPICDIDGDNRTHCFHPHMLLFPTTHTISEQCRQYFGGPGVHYKGVHEALTAERRIGHYLLLSEGTTKVTVFRPIDELPRQFARVLVAESVGNPDLASWRDHPQTISVLANATLLSVELTKS